MISLKLWLVPALSVVTSANGHERSSGSDRARLVNEFDTCVQARFHMLPSGKPSLENLSGLPALNLGMSRTALPLRKGRAEMRTHS